MSDSVASTNSTASKPPGHDIFCTPENSDFVSKVPYKSLSKTDHEIRLLKILPDSGSGFVECELLPAVSLATVHNKYLALSYCAGSAKNTKPIKVNGVNSNVFANLHHALTCARHYWETHAELPEFLLWVDQICINQFDLAERSHQVGFMRDIYHNAKRTLICLSTKETNGMGMRWLVELKDMVAQGRIKSDAHSIAMESEAQEFANGLASFSEIIFSPWWGRAWVFQEFMVSTHATFLFGRYAMSHDDFSQLATESVWALRNIDFAQDTTSRLEQKLEKHYISKSMFWQAFSPYDNILNSLGARREEPTPTDLESLLIYTRNCQASDQRDKIYSVLGLASPGYGIMPDYSPDNDIYKLLVETTSRIIAFEDSLSILLNIAPLRGSTRGDPRRPSWVVDWTDNILPGSSWIGHQDRKPKMGYFTDHKITGGLIDASFAVVPHPGPGPPGLLTTILQVWGIHLDTDFREVEQPKTSLFSSSTYEGSQHYMIQSSFSIAVYQELWVLCGAREPFLLTPYEYGYRLLVPVAVLNAVVEDGMTKFPQLMDDQGMYDVSKMDWKKITIF